MSEVSETWQSICAYLLSIALVALVFLVATSFVLVGEVYRPSYYMDGFGDLFLAAILLSLPLCVPLFWRASLSREKITLVKSAMLGGVGAGGTVFLLCLIFAIGPGLRLPANGRAAIVTAGISGVFFLLGGIGGAAFLAIKRCLART